MWGARLTLHAFLLFRQGGAGGSFALLRISSVSMTRAHARYRRVSKLSQRIQRP